MSNNEAEDLVLSVKKLAEREIPRFQSEEYYNKIPLDLFRIFAEFGLAGLNISEEFGGIAASPVTAAEILEEIAAVDLGPAIFISVHSMVCGLIERFGNLDQKRRFLPRLAEGKMLAAFALTEPNAGSDASNLQLQAVKSAANYELSGEKCYISSAGWAGLYLVFGRTAPGEGGKGISAFLVEAPLPGLSISAPERKMGCELSPIASMHFEKALVSAENLLGEEGGGYKVALGGLAGGRINIAACANGISRTALQRALAYVRERKQFNKAIFDFQGVQFMLADMAMKLQAGRAVTAQAANCLMQDPKSKQNRLLPSIAKCLATDNAMAITTDAVQLLGGAGYIKDYQVEKLMRDAKMLQIVEGTNQVQRMVIARELS